jgi:hypothetical protein
VGSVGIAAWIAKLAFVGLLIIGWTSGELRRKGTAVFVALGVAAWIGLPYLPRGGDFVTSAMALIDVALVFVVYKGDVRMI